MNKRRLSNKERKTSDEQQQSAELNASIPEWQRALIESIEKNPDSIRPIVELMKELR